jgi:hypothetical protein
MDARTLDRIERDAQVFLANPMLHPNFRPAEILELVGIARGLAAGEPPDFGKGSRRRAVAARGSLTATPPPAPAASPHNTEGTR